MITIRPADLDTDALAIVEGAHDFVERAGLHSIFPKSEQDFIAAVGRIVELPGMQILVAEQDKRIVGGVGVLFAPSLWNPAVLAGEELFWWTAVRAPFRTAHRLFEAALNRIDEIGAMPRFHSMQTSPSGVEKLYRRFGLTRTETSFGRP